jgi:hypothetical protein
MRYWILILLCSPAWTVVGQDGLQPFSPETRQPAMCVGEKLRFYSPILQEEREMNVYLPPSYADSSQKNYPLVVLLDGGTEEDFLHIAGLMQFLQFDWVQGIPECILVGIGNTHRQRDFTFPSTYAPDVQDFPESGASARFIQSVEQEFLPLLQASYRCDAKRLLIGQSLGGLLASEIMLKQPGLFNHYLIVSPSLWWSDALLLKDAPALLAAWPAEVDVSVYWCWGNEHPVMVEHAAKMAEILGAGVGLNFYGEYLPEYHHGDILHEAVERGLRRLMN